MSRRTEHVGAFRRAEDEPWYRPTRVTRYGVVGPDGRPLRRLRDGEPVWGPAGGAAAWFWRREVADRVARAAGGAVVEVGPDGRAR